MNLATMRPTAPAKWVCALRTAYLCGLILLISGCATVPPDNWSALSTETEAAATPIDCGSFPLPSESSETGVVYDKAGLNDLNDYRQCSEANESIASEHSKQIDQLKISRKGLTEAGRAQERIANMKQQALEDEQRNSMYSSIGYWIAILGLASAL